MPEGILGGTMTVPSGLIGTGDIVAGLIEASGAEKSGFQWQHGPTLNPFEPHAALDGLEFDNFDDEALANDGGFPDNDFFFPGDHWGCNCDFMPLWMSDVAPSIESASESENGSWRDAWTPPAEALAATEESPTDDLAGPVRTTAGVESRIPIPHTRSKK